MGASLNSRQISTPQIIADKVYLLADSSKLGESSFASLGRITLIDTLITDSKISPEQLQTLQELHVDIL